MIETDGCIFSAVAEEECREAGANIATSAALAADNQVVLKVNAFTEEEVLHIKPGTILISFMYAYTTPQLLVKLNEKRMVCTCDNRPNTATFYRTNILCMNAP